MNNISFIKKSKKYIVLFIILDIVFLFMLYILSEDSIVVILPFIVLFTIIALAISLYLEIESIKKHKKLLYEFNKDTNFYNRDKLIFELGDDYKNIINTFFMEKRNSEIEIERQRQLLKSYREFIEKWTHEIKTPLAISNLLIENHQNDMSYYVKEKIKYINKDIENYIDQVLYYARVDSEKIDYKLDKINLRLAVDLAMEKYYPIIIEEGIVIKDNVEDIFILSDLNTLTFIISQLLSNATKYTDDKIEIYIKKDKDINLIINNNGKKVPNEDAPFIFEKGFTGESNIRNKSTGMGLYLAKRYADDLGIGISILENQNNSFSMKLSFKKIEQF